MFLHSNASNSKYNEQSDHAQIWTSETLPRFYACPDYLQVKQILQSAQIGTSPRFYASPGYLQVWWTSDQNRRHYQSDKVKYGFFWHSRASYSEVNSPIWPEFELNTRFYSCPDYLQVWQRSDQKWSHYLPDNIFYYRSMGKFFVAERPATPYWIFRSRPNSNFAEILRLSWLSASLTKIQSKMKMLSIRHFPLSL